MVHESDEGERTRARRRAERGARLRRGKTEALTSPETSEARAVCWRCRRAAVGCYCAELAPFESGPIIVLLVHPKEARHPVGTCRITHRSIANSVWIEGRGPEFDAHPEVRRLIEDPSHLPFLLYPGQSALDLDGIDAIQAVQLFPPGRRPVIFLIDGTWSLARKMVHRSQRLQSLPQLMFRPESGSRYRIREQPAALCLSTLEATHEVLERFHRLGRYPLPGREHDRMLALFERMVEFQIAAEEGRD